MLFEIVRVVVVIALLGCAAALATPRGRLPLALRGVYRIMKKDRGETAESIDASAAQVPLWRRAAALALVFLSVLVAIM